MIRRTILVHVISYWTELRLTLEYKFVIGLMLFKAILYLNEENCFQFYSWRSYKQKKRWFISKKKPYSYTALTKSSRCFLYELFISYLKASDPFKQVNINDIVIIRWEIASHVKWTGVHSIFAMTVLYLIIFYWKIEARNGDLRVSNG